MKPTICVVVPARPPIDKYVAYKRVQLDHKDFFTFEMAFCDVNVPGPEHYQQWESRCSEGHHPILIDVGNRKYHKGQWLSASEMQKAASDTDGRVWNTLVELVNRNNTNGMLKGYTNSIAKWVREIYHVMASGSASQGLVFDHGMDVVNAFFFPQNKRDGKELFSNPLYSKLREMWEGFSVTENQVQPFTLQMYFRQLFRSGRAEGEILEKVGWWLTKHKQVEKLRMQAQAKTYEVRKFWLDEQCKRSGGLVHVNGYFEFYAALKQIRAQKLAVAVIRRETGNTHIQGFAEHGVTSFDQLDRVLEKQEPGRWYYETRFKDGPKLMNGSDQYTGEPASSLSDEEFIIKIVRNVALKPLPRTVQTSLPPKPPAPQPNAAQIAPAAPAASE